MKARNKKIIIVDDDLSVQKILTEKLKCEGFECFGACDGKEALKIIRKEKPDLILLDIVMPRLDGISVLKIIKKNKDTRKIIILVLTNLSSSHTLEESLKAGVTDYLIKADYTLDDLVRKIKEKLHC
ncbi:MAG: response regulator [Candidatus Paceibacterota bacterium]|jgi:DNA-binding response OmpR family regulator|nr:response regulator [Candidatus Paceibacterota bacterium]